VSLRLALRAWPFPDGMEAEAPDLLPERIESMSRAEVAALAVRVGRRDERLGDLFDIDGGPAGRIASGEADLTLAGDLRMFARLGAGMTRGRMVLEGSAGVCAGSGMSGGRLEIRGDAGARAGESMAGGVLVVRGSAGDDLGGAAPAAARGMNQGVILVSGHAGARAGRRMRRGIIWIGGDAGPLLGTGMLAGTIVVRGRAGDGAGAWMRRGTILLGAGAAPAAPAFAFSGSGTFGFWSLYHEALGHAGAPLPATWRGARFRRFVGDRSGGGLGEILIPDTHVRGSGGPEGTR
jgi:formylmethanofuran dehydrogenase subunit C